MLKVITTLIHAYRYLVSPFLPPGCRFEPSCSRYILQALNRYGLVKGGYLGVHRICRCHPFAKAGYDPVPESFPVIFPGRATPPHTQVSQKNLHTGQQ